MEPLTILTQWPYQVHFFFSTTLYLGVKCEKSLKFWDLQAHVTFHPSCDLLKKSISFLHILSYRT